MRDHPRVRCYLVQIIPGYANRYRSVVRQLVIENDLIDKILFLRDPALDKRLNIDGRIGKSPIQFKQRHAQFPILYQTHIA